MGFPGTPVVGRGTGTYEAVWWLGVALAVMAGIVHWPIQERGVPRLAADGR